MKAKVIGVMVGVLMAGWMGGTARAEDFILTGIQELTVNMAYGNGTLYDQSKAWVVSDGLVNNLYAYNSSTVGISGGSLYNLNAYDSSTVEISGGGAYGLQAHGSSTVNITSDGGVRFLDPYDSSTVTLSGGSVKHISARDSCTMEISGGKVNNDLDAYNSSNVTISGGTVAGLVVHDSSTVTISGGQVGLLYIYETSTVAFDGQDFILGTGLSLDGDRVLGTGVLSGKWFGGTAWTVNISANDPGATILAIPEPATMSLLGLGGLAMLRRRRRMA